MLAGVRSLRAYSSVSALSFIKSHMSNPSKLVLSYSLRASSVSAWLKRDEIAGFFSVSKAFQAIKSIL